jgi:hypothetical protein
MPYTYHGTSELIALPGRTVQAFPSGLVRVDRKYACRTASLDKFSKLFQIESFLPLENLLALSPGQQDFPRIFPNPNIENNENGYSIISASGYYPSTSKFIPKFSVQIYQISKSFTDTFVDDNLNVKEFSWTIFEEWFVENSNWSFVAPARQSIITYTPKSKMVFKFKRRRIIGVVGPVGPDNINITWESVQKNLTRRNFGFYDEIDSVSGPEPLF